MPNSIPALIAQASSGGGSLSTLLLLPLMGAVMYFLLIRPQRKRQKEMKDLQASLGVGDEVTTTSGIYGFITGVEDGLYWLEIDDDVQIRIAKAAVAGRVAAPTNKDDDPKSDANGSGKGDGANKSKGKK